MGNLMEIRSQLMEKTLMVRQSMVMEITLMEIR
jgi:hypothetical protein